MALDDDNLAADGFYKTKQKKNVAGCNAPNEKKEFFSVLQWLTRKTETIGTVMTYYFNF